MLAEEQNRPLVPPYFQVHVTVAALGEVPSFAVVAVTVALLFVVVVGTLNQLWLEVSVLVNALAYVVLPFEPLVNTGHP